MATIAEWLASLGLSEYAGRFVENDVDLDVLPELTDRDLERLGISLGHRRKILRAIRELGTTADAAVQPTSAPEPKRREDAERRQVTVMFTDLVGSTALSTELDPEDLRRVIGAYHKRVADTVAQFDGFVAKYMGDGVLVYFGYPDAHEDDAERAVRAGLALVEAVGRLSSEEPLRVRIGVATGLVVVGDLLGSGEAQERGIVGETPNLAARLQNVAEPNAVVIAESTRKLLGNLFELHDLGRRDLKGIGQVRAWAALRPSPIESRFEALHGGALTPLVGRDEETEILVRRWQRAKRREGQVVLLSGEPGIGKSRLTAWLLERISSEAHTRLRYFCSPQHADSALHPIIGQLERAAGFVHGDDAASKLDKLGVLLSRTSTSISDAWLFADLLSLPPGRYPVLDLAPQRRRQKTLEALVWQLEVLSSQQAVLMVFEDAQWIDPTSLEVLGRTIDRIRNLPVLLIVTFRPEFDPPWTGQPNVTTLTLNRLGQREVEGMIERVVGNSALPADIMAEIIERTDGIPLFVEEMTSAILEADESELRHIASTVPSGPHPVPATLYASLMARLDRLGSAKEVAQVGAVIGREFSYELITLVAPHSEQELQDALERLRRAGLVFRQGTPPLATFLFKHALVQDAAYGTLLREPRRAIHARIAAALTETFPEVVEIRPEILAHHYTEAGLAEQAASFWGKAGQRSIARSALNEAVVQLTRALSQLATLPETATRRREEIKLQTALASGLMLTRGYSSPDAISAFEKARSIIENAESLGDRMEDPLLKFSVMYGLWVSSYVASDVKRLRERAEQFLAIAENMGASAALQIGHRLTATTKFMLGHFRTAQTHADRAVALYSPDEHRPLAVQFGQDIGATALAYRGWTLWHLGYPEAALTVSDQLMRNAREFGQAATLMHALYHVALIEIWSGRLVGAETHTEELIALAEATGSQIWRTFGTISNGWTLSMTGRAADAIEAINAGLEAYRSSGSKAHVPMYLAALARAYACCGQFEPARITIYHALDVADATTERWAEAEIHRTAGEITLLSTNPGVQKAESHFLHGVTIARKQEARSYELRTATSLARLWRDQGRPDEARDLLAQIYGWFTEGFDTPDLKEAKALLEQLAA